jgi:hypothetical protein
MSLWAAATKAALEDPGTEKLRWLCWAVAGVKRLPIGWTTNPKLLAMGNNHGGACFEEVQLIVYGAADAASRTP